MNLIDENLYDAGVCTYTDTFYAFIPWLKLNHIRYIIEETDIYTNGLIIKIYKGETKRERKLIRHYMSTEFPKIRDRIRKEATL